VSGGTVVAPNLNAPVVSSRLGRAREAVFDIVIVTAVVWVPILLLGGLAAILRRLF
jgi:hypothetical protein